MADGDELYENNDSVLNRILSWSRTRPLWQRDALRRIVLDGYPNEAALNEILDLCKKEHGDYTVTLTAEPLTEDHIPINPRADESISLSSIANAVGVNQLASRQSLSFETTGLSIVYGQNGTGKSGYTRILKKACRSRHAGEIMPDVYNQSHSESASADLSYLRANGKIEHIQWKDQSKSPEVLSAITVFDKEAASVHIQKKNEVWFRPFGLDVPEDLVRVCQYIKSCLNAEKDNLAAKRNAIFENPTWSARSELGKVLSALQHDTDLAEIEAATPFTEKDETQLNQLQSDLAQDPALAAEKQHAYATQLDQMTEYLSRIERALKVEAIQALFEAKQRFNESRTAADTAAHDAFSELTLQGVGEPVWSNLWESARAYSKSMRNEGNVFPPPAGDICVLCHQEIDNTTATRMLGFEEFIKNDTETKAAEAKKELDDAMDKFRELEVHVRKVQFAYRGLKSRNFPLAKSVIRYIAIAKLVQKQTLAKLLSKEVRHPANLPDPLTEAVKAEAKEALEYASSLKTQSDGSNRETILAKLENLRDRKHSVDFLEIARTEVIRLQALHMIENCLRDTASAAITHFGNGIANDLITPHMKENFKNEIVELAKKDMRVEVVCSGKLGSTQYQVKLFGNKNAQVHDVLSEGEQTCVALASYLTELTNAAHVSALVFDDPVSSLDHKWRLNVATRLVKEAKVRQIIVFTHDMVFVNDLIQLAADQEIPIALSHLTRGPNEVGIVNKDLPWTASGIRDRIDKLEKSASKAKLIFNLGNDEYYKVWVSSLYSKLRATWERALEDVVFANVIVRHRDYINTNNLMRVTALDKNDVEVFRCNFKKCCELVDAHDPSRGHDPEPPGPEEIIDDIRNLRDWTDTLRERMNAIANC